MKSRGILPAIVQASAVCACVSVRVHGLFCPPHLVELHLHEEDKGNESEME